MTRTIELCFDYVSPYAYLASTQLRALAAKHEAEVSAVPVLFAGLLASTGARGPAEIPARRAYLVHDVTRLGRALGVPIAPPATHPFNPLVPLRTTLTVEGETRWRLVEALFRAAWVEARRIDEAEVVAAIASEIGLDGPALVGRAAEPGPRAALRAATDDAIARGAFGVPSMFVDDQLFWGLDSLALLERHLAGTDTPDAAALARWWAVRPSATRRA